MEVSVHRLITYEGVEMKDEAISTDFYVPLPKIELHSLKKENDQSPGNVNVNVNVNVNEEVETPQDNEPSSESDKTDEDPDAQSENDPPKAIQYDKGGNIIH